MWLLNHIYNHCLERPSCRLASANTDDGAWLDVRAGGFWKSCQDAYFDVRVFHPNAPSNRSRSPSAMYKKHEDEKNVWPACTWNWTWRLHATYTFNLRWYGKRSSDFLQTLGRLAVSETRRLLYSSLMGWLRCKLSFAILRSTVIYIRGSRSSMHHAIRDSSDIVLTCSEGCVPQEF